MRSVGVMQSVRYLKLSWASPGNGVLLGTVPLVIPPIILLSFLFFLNVFF